MLVMEHLVIVQARGEEVVGCLKGCLASILNARLSKGHQVFSLPTRSLLHKWQLLEVKLRIFAFPYFKTKKDMKPIQFGSTCFPSPFDQKPKRNDR